MAVVADPPTDSLVSQPAREKRYASRRGDLRLVHTPRYDVYAAGGRKISESKGIIIKFQDGQLVLPLEGKVKTEQGHQVESAEIVEWLDGHHLNGDQHEGFFEVPQAAPSVSEAETELIGEYGLTHNTDALRAMLEAERRGWNRAGLVGPIEKTIVRIEQIRADYEENVAAQAAEAEVKPAAKAKPGSAK